MDVISVFGMACGIIVIGFLGNLLFEKTKISDILVLLLLGLLIGPIFGFVSPRLLIPLAPYFAALALIIILFDGGLGLSFDRVLRQISVSTLHSTLGFILSVISVTIPLYFFFHYPLSICILLGTILGGTSGAIVIPLISKMSANEDTKTLLELEAVFTDVLCVIVAISIIQVIQGTAADYTIAFKNLASAFSIAIVIGLIFGILWLRVLRSLHNKRFSYMITIASLFGLYAFVEKLGGNGAMSALVVGLVLSNAPEVVRIFKMQTGLALDGNIKHFHAEISFFIRTFFFVYLGMIVSFQPFDYLFTAVYLMMLVGIVASRFVVVKITTSIRKEMKDDVNILWTMMPRGLAAAVLAYLPFSSGIKTAVRFPEFAFVIIILTNIIVTCGVFAIERRKVKETKCGEEKRKVKKVKVGQETIKELKRLDEDLKEDFEKVKEVSSAADTKTQK